MAAIDDILGIATLGLAVGVAFGILGKSIDFMKGTGSKTKNIFLK